VGQSKAGRSSAALLIRLRSQRRLVSTYSIGAVKPSHGHTVRVAVNVPGGLPAGSFPIQACADSAGSVKERSESNNCLSIGRVTIAGSGPSPTPTPNPNPSPNPPISPIAYTPNTPQDLAEAQGDYWLDVPPSYDSTNGTPETLLVWLHGCGGDAQGDSYEVAPGDDRSYIAISIGGRDGACWDPNSDVPKVLAAIADVKTHFNIDRRRVIIAGYSSGGDLAYRTIFYNANEFAGILAENTSPFRDTGSTQAQSLGAAAWKFNAVHLAHQQDDTYPLAGVTVEVSAMKDAGFPVTLITVPGDHYEPDETPTTPGPTTTYATTCSRTSTTAGSLRREGCGDRDEPSVVAGEVLVETAGVGVAQLWPGGGQGRVGGGAGAAAPAGEGESEHHQPREQQQRRKDVDGEVEAVGGRLGQYRVAVLRHQVPLDLSLGLSLGHQGADEVALGDRLGRLGQRQGLVA
jgi:hypothetical protein